MSRFAVVITCVLVLVLLGCDEGEILQPTPTTPEPAGQPPTTQPPPLVIPPGGVPLIPEDPLERINPDFGKDIGGVPIGDGHLIFIMDDNLHIMNGIGAHSTVLSRWTDLIQ